MSDNLTPLDGDARILNVNIEEQMKTSFIDYAMSVIVSRALPDVRDGMKPIHRRILYTMNELSNTFDKPYKKSSKIVGDVMGNYHPHGDAAIYEAMVRLGQDWNMRYLLIDGQGNYGSPDGDGPAAMRYTEARLKKISDNILVDIEKDTVDFQRNYNDEKNEPTVLPTRIPQILINGTSGIAVGMATSMMPHNLTEVIDACLAYIENKELTIDDIIKIIKAPDFPHGGIIYGIDGIHAAMRTGRGRVVLRGKTTIERTANGNKEQIIITNVPYQVNRDELTGKIANLVNNKIIEGISDVANESNKDGTRIVVELKKDAVSQVVTNLLFKHTELQTSFGINNVAIVKGRPRTLNIKEILSEFVEFRHEVVLRRTRFELRKAEERLHILEGFIKAINHLDEVIKIIRESNNPEIAKNQLITQFDFSEIQTKAILELRLQRLTGMELEKIKQEYDDVVTLVNKLKEILATESLQFKIIADELTEIKEKFGDERRSEIQYLSEEMDMIDFIEKEDVVITISSDGYIKRTPITEYRQQRRGGRGAKGVGTKSEDWIEHLFIASTHDTLICFSELGKCYWLKVYEIPQGEKTSKGRAIQNLLQLTQNDKIKTVLNVANLNDADYLNSHNIVLCTKKGIIKKTSLEGFSRPRIGGIIAITIEEGDKLLEAKLTDGKSQIMLALKSGRAIRFNEAKVRNTGRGAIGVFGIETQNAQDELIGMICVSAETEEVLVVSENGYGKRTLVEEYRTTNRGGKGVKTINVTEKTGFLIGFLKVSEDNDLMITCKSGIIIRMDVSKIRSTGRNAQGVKLISLTNNDQIAAIATLEKDDEEEIIETPTPNTDNDINTKTEE